MASTAAAQMTHAYEDSGTDSHGSARFLDRSLHLCTRCRTRPARFPRDKYEELTLRRRRAQIAARHAVEEVECPAL